jgi:hypothetical protein
VLVRVCYETGPKMDPRFSPDSRVCGGRRMNSLITVWHSLYVCQKWVSEALGVGHRNPEDGSEWPLTWDLITETKMYVHTRSLNI